MVYVSSRAGGRALTNTRSLLGGLVCLLNFFLAVYTYTFPRDDQRQRQPGVLKSSLDLICVVTYVRRASCGQAGWLRQLPAEECNQCLILLDVCSWLLRPS